MATSTSPAATQVKIPTRVIIVCCNSIYTGGPSSSPLEETNWLLKPFQQSTPTKQGEHLTFIQHILAAVSLYSGSPETSTVIFSGGPTSHTHPTLSEAQSYFHAFLQSRDSAAKSGVDILLEENATDSYQNILFSISLFRTRYNSYPKSMTIIAHAFKEPRFLNLHAKALRWPSSQITVRGIDPPFTKEEREWTIASENKNGYTAWEADLYGTRPFLSGKRKQRRWKEETTENLCVGLEEVVQQLLRWDGGESGVEVFPHVLPWEK